MFGTVFTGKTPSITTAQILAVVGWVGAQAVAFGWITDSQQQVLISGGATIVAAAWKIADAFLRGKRAAAMLAPAAAAKK